MSKKVLFLSLLLFILFNLSSQAKTESDKLYISDNTLYYECPGETLTVSEKVDIDIKSVKILNNKYFRDKNNVYVAWEDGHSYVCGFNKITDADPETFIVYSNFFQKDKNNVYSNTSYWGWGTPRKIENLDIDPTTFEPLAGYYAKDKNNVYVFTFDNNGTVKVVNKADITTFEVLNEDESYAMDKTNMYRYGEILNKKGEKITNQSLYTKLKGKIILKIESKGEAYYVHPNKSEMHFLSYPLVAFYVMREQGIGISNNDLEKIPVASNYCPSYKPDCDNLSMHNTSFANTQKGKIFLQVEENGEAWYVNSNDSKRYFLGRPTDAFNVMRNLGLGVSNTDFEKLN